MGYLFGITSALVGLVLVLVYFYWKKLRAPHYWQLKNVPCETPNPILGSFLVGLLSGKTFFEIEKVWYERYGRIFGEYTGANPMIAVGEPELLRGIFVKDFHVFTNRREFRTSNKVQANFMAMMMDDDWRRVRSVISPTFSSGKLKKMIPMMKDCLESSMKALDAAAKTGEPTECKRILSAYTLDTICSTAFGTKIESANDPDCEFAKHVHELKNKPPWKGICIMMFPKLASMLNIATSNEDSMQFFLDFCQAAADARRKSKEVRNDMLQMLIDAEERGKGIYVEPEGEIGGEWEYFKQYSKNKTITSDEFLAQCVLFLLSGNSSTANTLVMIIYYLALNPECQDKLIEEVDAAWEKHSEITSDALLEMKYLDNVLSETLRLAPQGTRLERQASQDYPLGNTGIVIPAGMVVSIPVYSMHRDPKLFPDPERFDPDRFLPENKEKMIPYSYIPFGAGPRNCIGNRFTFMQMKIFLSHIYRHYLFQSCPQTEIPVQLVKAAPEYIPISVTLTVKKR